MIIKTILFDFDGVVVDSERLHLKALGEVLHNHGISYPNDLLNDFVGKNDSLFYQYVIDNLNSSYELDYLLKQKNKIFDKIVRELQPIDGFLDFIDIVIQKNIPRAIVTSSSGETLKMVSEIFPFQNYIDIVVCEEDTTRHKPHPEPYLLALERTGGEKETTLIIEDSANGIKAGKSAGCIVFGLTTSLPRKPLLEAGADKVFDSYKEISDFIHLE
ncbi:MAG: Phosphorylated carbohydrates phosphatase [Bacteroidetes bacterium ADurb.Bin174]|jgi:HAD superfamily hydrolase (TIGR01509 family)|nr:MAG: Phosphorylated carbohydrates phosphatase [Bacteroidetes bacterium ADurb.Bin174]